MAQNNTGSIPKDKFECYGSYESCNGDAYISDFATINSMAKAYFNILTGSNIMASLKKDTSAAHTGAYKTKDGDSYEGGNDRWW